MRWEAIARDWPQYGGAIRRHWPELRDERLSEVAGRHAWLVDCLQECYGLPRDQAESEISAWMAALGDADDADRDLHDDSHDDFEESGQAAHLKLYCDGHRSN